ncbi:short chain dehydrogenase [Embleya hyalina]|uniref:Short-chain dehydrogenase n=1 Tax=Embleya hyalina TaxID=516124 RepID=A0A401Z6H6_9ACTN|nr:short chain dehydrogenase [Embleya hyalina]GCE02418.1 short-chain dehydrogenase [Embleya hyalina]
MKVLVVGATGTLGAAVTTLLATRHDVVTASRTGPTDVKVDIVDPASIAAMYEQVGRVDAVACTAGSVPFKEVGDLSREDVESAALNKLLGQVELVRRGLDAVADNGSFTLITGILAGEPVRTGSMSSMANGGIDAFVRGAAVELPRGLRINSVSPTVFTESAEAYDAVFPGFPPVDVATAALAYRRSIEGAQTGQTFRVGW